MVVSGGYPEDFEKEGNFRIRNRRRFDFSCRKLDNGNVVSNGGRVLAVTSYGNDFEEEKSYQNIDKLHFDKMYFIGNDLN
jgi:phosphoribosylamine--glycine ligase